MSSSFKNAAPKVKGKVPGPLFRVGEIWDRNEFFEAWKVDQKRRSNQLEQVGFRFWEGLVLIDQLADLIRTGTPLPPFEAKYKQRRRKKE